MINTQPVPLLRFATSPLLSICLERSQFYTQWRTTLLSDQCRPQNYASSISKMPTDAHGWRLIHSYTDTRTSSTPARRPHYWYNRSLYKRPRRPVGSWGASRGVWAAGQGRFSSPSALPWGGPICSAVSSAGLPTSRKMRSYWRESSGGLRG